MTSLRDSGSPARTDGATGSIGVGMLGYGFMGRAHSGAYRELADAAWSAPLSPRLVAVVGRDEAAVTGAARRLGFAGSHTDWRSLLDDDRIGLFDNTAPNDQHMVPTIAAVRSGRHVLCEKPLGRTADEAFAMWAAAAAADVRHMCAFNYRFVPAVRLAREMITGGELGEILHFRGRYLQDWMMTADVGPAWRGSAAIAGSGAVGDLGAHVIDLARYLLGEEVTDIAASTRTFDRGHFAAPVDVDDAVEAVVGFEGGAVGTVEASRFCAGRKNALSWEVSGTRGSIAFDLERLNELEVNLSNSRPGPLAQGFRRVLVSEPEHPFWAERWPPGHMLGWEHTFTHEIDHLLAAIAAATSVRPHGADFEDGYRVAEVCDAALRSAATGRREVVSYRTLP